MHMDTAFQHTRKQNNALLILLGEKEEELQALRDDIKDVKNLYKNQISQLLEKLVPELQ